MKYLIILLLFTSCASLNGGTKGKVKYTKVSCPTYPKYVHYVRTDGLKNKNPEACPMMHKKDNNLP